jgi:riboflavin synthase
LGRIGAVIRAGDEVRLRVAAPFLGTPRRGESIAVDGVCLTVVRSGRGWFETVISPETLSRTTLALRGKGEGVNLERPVRAGDRLGGHLVQGHVDEVGLVEMVRSEGTGTRVRIGFPRTLRDFIVLKGSISVDGISLTVAALGEGWLEVALIPETLEVTRAGAFAPGTPVNLEVDMMGRYVVECVKRQRSEDRSAVPVTRELLARHGFIGRGEAQ